MITFNPQLVTNAQGSFNVESTGYIAGVALDDPSARNWLRGGILAATETLPMWGGLPISARIPPAVPTDGGTSSLGATITRATTIPLISGFSVFNQDHSMINTPQSPVPLASNHMMVAYYLFGSRARIPVPCDPALASQVGALYDTPVTWDFTAGRLIAGVAGPLALPVNLFIISPSNNIVPVFDPATGFCTWNRNGSVAVIELV
jgi:hypothetical protein